MNKKNGRGRPTYTAIDKAIREVLFAKEDLASLLDEHQIMMSLDDAQNPSERDREVIAVATMRNEIANQIIDTEDAIAEIEAKNKDVLNLIAQKDKLDNTLDSATSEEERRTIMSKIVQLESQIAHAEGGFNLAEYKLHQKLRKKLIAQLSKSPMLGMTEEEFKEEMQDPSGFTPMVKVGRPKFELEVRIAYAKNNLNKQVFALRALEEENQMEPTDIDSIKREELISEKMGRPTGTGLTAIDSELRKVRALIARIESGEEERLLEQKQKQRKVSEYGVPRGRKSTDIDKKLKDALKKERELLTHIQEYEDNLQPLELHKRKRTILKSRNREIQKVLDARNAIPQPNDKLVVEMMNNEQAISRYTMMINMIEKAQKSNTDPLTLIAMEQAHLQQINKISSMKDATIAEPEADKLVSNQ